MAAPSAGSLLAAWEAGLAESPLDRAPLLLRSLAVSGESRDPAAMTVGECDRGLLGLRQLLFGTDLEAVGRCPRCRQEAEFQVQLAAIEPPDGAPAVTIEAHGYQMTCRLPTNADLGHVASLGTAAGAADLLQRCLISSEGPDGQVISGDVIPPEVADAALRALAEEDPGAEIRLMLECPECGARWQELLDIRAVLWAELTEWAHGVLSEIHALATCYGWSELDILGLSAWRRRYYLEACGW